MIRVRCICNGFCDECATVTHQRHDRASRRQVVQLGQRHATEYTRLMESLGRLKDPVYMAQTGLCRVSPVK
jgi:hypothetical protein